MKFVHPALSGLLFTSAVLNATIARPAAIEAFTEPLRRIEVAPAETGTILRLSVHEGDRIRAGQELAVLDNDVLNVSLDIARATRESSGKLKSVLAERDVRKNRYEKLARLHAEGNATAEEVDRAKGDLAIADANVVAAEEQRQLDALECKKIEAMLERRILRSPIDGIVLKVHRDVHEYVSANNATVFTVVQLDSLRATFNIPTAQAAGLSVGKKIDLTLPETSAHLQGTVEFIAPMTDAESGTVRVKVRMGNPQGQYACGVRCKLDMGGDAIVPAANERVRPASPETIPAPPAARAEPAQPAAADSALAPLTVGSPN